MSHSVLFHGSTIADLDLVEPTPATGVGPASDKQVGIYASHEPNYAISFALPILPDQDGNTSWSFVFDEATTRPRITIEAGTLDLEQKGCLYMLPADSFEQIDEYQWLARSPVAPINVMLVEPMMYRFWVEGTEPDYTKKQGQYLAFLHYYQKLNGRAPAQTDFQKYFRTTPPTIHQMILTLERRGFISRVPGQARSLELLLRHDQLPGLE